MSSAAAVLIVASVEELPAGDRVWGTGGWVPPENREALDWLTLARLLGWTVNIASPGSVSLEATVCQATRAIVIACDPEVLPESFFTTLVGRLEKDPVLVIVRASTRTSPLARLTGVYRRPEAQAGRTLRWTGPEGSREWHCSSVLSAWKLDIDDGCNVDIWTTLEDRPLIVSRRLARAVLVVLAFHPSSLRDQDGAGTSLLKHLLIWGAPGPVAWLDFRNTLVLRMDDPGGAQNIYYRDWCYPKLMEGDWEHITTDLTRRDARLSLAYISGWVDDGDASRGTLTISGREVVREPAKVYPSPLVFYRDTAGHAPGTEYDYASEYRGIQRLRNAGRGDVEMHGFTHLHPDLLAWSEAVDRYEAKSWFRELGRSSLGTRVQRRAEEHPLVLARRLFWNHFGVQPTTLICPGDEWTNGSLRVALQLGLDLVGSYYLAVRHDDRFCWAQHVCAPYLNRPDRRWFDAELPVVGYFHDRELLLEGVEWMTEHLDAWQRDGAERLVDFREVASALQLRLSAEQGDGSLALRVARDDPVVPLVRPVKIAVRVPPTGPHPSQLSVVEQDGYRTSIEVAFDGDVGHLWFRSRPSHADVLS